MCKAIDNPNHHQARQREATTAASVDEQQQPLNDDFSTSNNNNKSTENNKKTTKKRVRFHTVICSIDEFPKVTDPTEKGLVWYNRKDYDAMKNEIGVIVNAKTTNDYQIQRDETFYCFRGLEFLKLDDDIPSRKERRAMFSEQVMAYQGVVVTAQHNKCYININPAAEEEEEEEQQQEVEDPDNLIGSFCSKLSESAKERAIGLANQDETEARYVYQQCHLLYRGENGEELCMFGIDETKRSSLCRRSSATSSSEETTTTLTTLTKHRRPQASSTSSIMAMSIYNPFVQDVLFSYDTLRRVISPLFSSSTTKATTTTTTTTAAAV